MNLKQLGNILIKIGYKIMTIVARVGEFFLSFRTERIDSRDRNK
jgi:hypothetical protein